MVLFIPMDQHIPNSIVKFQTHIYSCLNYLCMCMGVPQFPRINTFRVELIVLCLLPFILRVLLYSLHSPTNSQIRKEGVTLDSSSYTHS